MNYPSQTLIGKLKSELVDRSRRNPKYSLRAFAKSLGISPAYLSQVFSGKRMVSPAMAQKLIGAIAAESSLQRKVLKEIVGGSKQLEVRHFAKIEPSFFDQIAEWHFYAILSLIDTEDFQPDVRWMANRLGLPFAIVGEAVEKLIRLGILDTSKPRWTQKIPPIKVSVKVPTAASRRFQRAMIEKALESQNDDPYEVRDLASCTMAISPKILHIAREKIAAARRKLMLELEELSAGRQTEVYNLNTQLIPLSKVREKK